MLSQNNRGAAKTTRLIHRLNVMEVCKMTWEKDFV